jgi:hypothetical protein
MPIDFQEKIYPCFKRFIESKDKESLGVEIKKIIEDTPTADKIEFVVQLRSFLAIITAINEGQSLGSDQMQALYNGPMMTMMTMALAQQTEDASKEEKKVKP